MVKPDIKNMSKGELEDCLKEMGQAPYRSRQIFRWLYKTRARSFDGMTDIAEHLRRSLKDRFRISHLVMLDSKRSLSDGTAKYLFKLEDGSTIETVFIPERRRKTVCLSSQVGCKYACSFCASAPFGFVRNLSASEILNQVIFLKAKNEPCAITNLVFMGIGEPMDNYDNVMKAIRIFNDSDAFHIGARRITISTCGIIPGIERLKAENMQIELSISLHSARDDVRSHLIPVNKRYPLKDLISACRRYIEETNRVITFEYILIKGVNSSTDDASCLAELLKGVKCKVNIISYNRTGIKGFEKPSEKDVRAFVSALKARGINVTRRRSKGEEIDAGCGQLRISRLSAETPGLKGIKE